MLISHLPANILTRKNVDAVAKFIYWRTHGSLPEGEADPVTGPVLSEDAQVLQDAVLERIGSWPTDGLPPQRISQSYSLIIHQWVIWDMLRVAQTIPEKTDHAQHAINAVINWLREPCELTQATCVFASLNDAQPAGHTHNYASHTAYTVCQTSMNHVLWEAKFVDDGWYDRNNFYVPFMLMIEPWLPHVPV